MLDQNTKNIIDSARDYLVGKLPAPNSQVDQITLAMLYKFMDDIDQETLSYGGRVKYFANEFSKYSWREIMRKSVSAQERMNLYIEALEKFSTNPELPVIFRDIFKNATVPYRDPEILTLFLNEIGKLDYINDSEKLGDAYEYLLSILGSQGGLGQFRTPRHIIDFVVKVVQPSKTDKILDPACGTAGFLISAYKYIISKDEYLNLSYEEKNRILSNITGYDIEPSMVRISEMNMYLHGCSIPDINEYDSLTSDDYWYDKFDVILANPPFMTPKGGISPHNKFQVKAKRAEVLFVDYICEHLKPEGKAGIVVPDSILFNPNSKFTEVRKMLVDQNNVYAIVSLPSGVFLPYSEVKTSVIFIDKKIASKSNTVAFFEANNDGYSLGSARNENSKNDLGWICEEIEKYKSSILSGVEYNIPSEHSEFVKVLTKERIKSHRHFLMPKKYRDVDNTDKAYEFIRLGDILVESKLKVGQQNMDVWSVSKVAGFVSGEELFSEKVASEDITKYKVVKPYHFAYNPARINVGSIAFNDSELTGCVSPMYTVFKLKDDCVINPKYIFAILKSKSLIKEYNENAYGSVRQQLRFEDLQDIYIPKLSPEEELEYVNKIIEIENKKRELDNLQGTLDELINSLFED